MSILATQCENSCIGRQARPHFYKVAFDDGDHEEYTLPELKKLMLLGDGAGRTKCMDVYAFRLRLE